MQRVYCHNCTAGFPIASADWDGTCPRCHEGFVEVLEQVNTQGQDTLRAPKRARKPEACFAGLAAPRLLQQVFEARCLGLCAQEPQGSRRRSGFQSSFQLPGGVGTVHVMMGSGSDLAGFGGPFGPGFTGFPRGSDPSALHAAYMNNGQDGLHNTYMAQGSGAFHQVHMGPGPDPFELIRAIMGGTPFGGHDVLLGG
jgi:hypothetical protein